MKKKVVSKKSVVQRKKSKPAIANVQDPMQFMVEELLNGFSNQMQDNSGLTDTALARYKVLNVKNLNVQQEREILNTSIEFFNSYFVSYLLKNPSFATMYYKTLQDLGEDAFVKAIFNFLKMQTQNSDIVIGVMPMAERPFNTKINEDVFKLVLDKAISQSLSASAVIANDEDFC